MVAPSSYPKCSIKSSILLLAVTNVTFEKPFWLHIVILDEQ